MLTYREGEPLRELSKYLGAAARLRSAARPASSPVCHLRPPADAHAPPPAADGAAEGAPLEVRIPADAVTAANRQARARWRGICVWASGPPASLRSPSPAVSLARQVRARQLWGTDVYTEDSDLVAVLVHTGFYALPSGAGAAPPPGLTELRATLRPVPPQEGAQPPTPRISIAPCATRSHAAADRQPGARQSTATREPLARTFALTCPCLRAPAAQRTCRRRATASAAARGATAWRAALPRPPLRLRRRRL